ncbi:MULTISPECIES: aldehyde dehydrogenase family protein [unclassified Sphingomonas]|uniref:aldehyde dehydrogenase family protein n=1 Tax=unclassified Sphingomonas TaxID=196159 RepID=UPI0006FA8F81|nr:MULTISPECIES: aldehyde dehydrogenase family protein [unclassified Sphingomonas]KQX23560.1 betaine-aldehyde dehydrogenase [Sphingomonas sp. Root1294]KQY68410.1 betaine-aldehyde dehydrogenase [Sphingomonas sp. Root50]KRB91313.1 betaine-aldehyde dehydrogenase [Sphingomonas sp. Root720]
MNQHNPIQTRPAFLNGKPKKLLIDGKWVEALSGKSFGSFNPSTGEALDPVAEGGREDVDLAVAAARRAFEGPWSRFKPAERQRVILKLADLIEANFEELFLLDAIDMGSPIAALPFLQRLVVDTFRFCAGMATGIQGETLPNSVPGNILSYTMREPVGVVGGIVPWNGPVFNATWKIAPALATGCTLVLKPAEQASLSALRLGELCLEAGVPPGVVNILTGFGETAGAALAAHLDVDKVAFTGSCETGQRIVQASAGNLKRLTLELGGKSPDIVFADADLDAAVPGAAMAVFANSGQVCSAGSRLFVERQIYDEFVEKVGAFAKSLRVGNSLDPSTMIGPLVSQGQLERVTGYLEAGAREGARAVAGGSRLTDGDLAKGYFVPPTLFADVDDDMTIAREEIFGPVISAIPFDDVEEVVKRANNTVFGLGSGVWTRDVKKAHKLAGLIRAGSVWVNCYQAMDPAVPFGGYKMSGYGSESGKHHLDEYLNVKSVWINID